LLLGIGLPLDFQLNALFQGEQHRHVGIDGRVDVGGAHVQAVRLNELEEHVRSPQANAFGQ
jgi:hypothetical protein